jgi:hypothetical protein
LAVTDLITGLVTGTTYAEAVLEGLDDGRVNIGFRTVEGFSGFITYTSGVLFVVALALERVFATVFVVFHRNYFRFKTSLIVSCLIWFYSVCFAVLQFMGINEDAYNLADIYLHHAMPMITIILAYSVLYCWLRKRHRATIPAQLQNTGVPELPRTTQQTLQVRQERQLVTVVMLTGLILFLSLAPYFVVMMIDVSCSSCNHNVLYSSKIICIPVLFLNSVINPYLYAWRLPQHKRSFMAILPNCIK